MPLSTISLFAMACTTALVTAFVAGLSYANAAPGTPSYSYPSALDAGTLVYGPEDLLFEHIARGHDN